MNKKFISGIITGNVITLVSLMTVQKLYKKNITTPLEQKKDFVEANRKKANRKRISH